VWLCLKFLAGTQRPLPKLQHVGARRSDQQDRKPPFGSVPQGVCLIRRYDLDLIDRSRTVLQEFCKRSSKACSELAKRTDTRICAPLLYCYKHPLADLASGSERIEGQAPELTKLCGSTRDRLVDLSARTPSCSFMHSVSILTTTVIASTMLELGHLSERGQMDTHAVWLDTLVTRTDRAPGAPAAVAPVLHQTATFRAADDASFLEMASTPRHSAYYTRDGNPTISNVESLIAALEGAESCLLTASGMGAMSTAVLGLVRQGDHVVAQRTHYMGTTQLLTEVLPRFGVDVSMVDQVDSDAIEEAVTAKTRLVMIETPANPLLTLTDLARVAELARRHGVLTLCDNTIGTPVNQQPIGLGIDLVVHSATKFLGGHHDLMAGAIVGTRALVDQIWRSHVVLGAVADPFAGWLLIRGLRTLVLRVQRQNQTALRLAKHLAEHPKVSHVHYPGLLSHPQHALALQQMRGGFGGLLSIELRGGFKAGNDFINAMRLPARAVSFGGFESLATQPAAMWAGSIGDSAAEAAGIAPGLIRLAVGLEHPDDLLEDLDQALQIV
jgi:cystathionine beta-lyase/cystathionine gamma-synthase